MEEQKYYFILGAADPEMERIEKLLQDADLPYGFAAAGGERVRPFNAYRADGIIGHPVPEGTKVIHVECDGPGLPLADMIVDHHREGDPGYGRLPEEFLQASSVGQMCQLLTAMGVVGFEIGQQKEFPFFFDGGEWRIALGDGLSMQIEQDIVLAAAADHCLGAAYKGQCPGVDPDALMVWRATTRAKFQGRSVQEVLDDVRAAMAEIEQAPVIEIGGVPGRDMRRGSPVPELPEAATRLGVNYVSGPLVGRDGEIKYTASGVPVFIRAWMEQWAPAQGLVKIYGDPARGFAGGYAR